MMHVEPHDTFTVTLLHRILIALAAFLVFSACATGTDISKLNLNEIHAILSADSVIPGREYWLQVEATTLEGERIIDVNHNRLILFSPLLSFTVLEQYRNFILLRAKSRSFDLLEEKEFLLNIRIPNSDFPVQRRRWPPNWTGYREHIFAGANGRHGQDGSSQSGDGADGKDGADGAGGPDLMLDVAYYDAEGSGLQVSSPMIVIYERRRRFLLLFPRQQFRIGSIGGKGRGGVLSRERTGIGLS